MGLGVLELSSRSLKPHGSKWRKQEILHYPLLFTFNPSLFYSEKEFFASLQKHPGRTLLLANESSFHRTLETASILRSIGVEKITVSCLLERNRSKVRKTFRSCVSQNMENAHRPPRKRCLRLTQTTTKSWLVTTTNRCWSGYRTSWRQKA